MKQQQYAVGVDKYGEAIYTAATTRSAQSQAWRAWKVLRPDLSFAAFVKLSSVRKIKTGAKAA